LLVIAVLATVLLFPGVTKAQEIFLCEASRKTLDAKLRTGTVRLQHFRFDGCV
jgi:hypothetical protein